jgi:hypothetical protein
VVPRRPSQSWEVDEWGPHWLKWAVEKTYVEFFTITYISFNAVLEHSDLHCRNVLTKHNIYNG